MDTPKSANQGTEAAVYVRMSTEHQQYSTANQIDVIQEFAKRRGLNILATYSDEGKSGLSIHGREALERLISDVNNGCAEFKHILVYDVSRWGRFQDADESAYYEYVCRRAGKFVHYCAEQFDNDGSPMSTIIKSVKRAMAGEFSRELSTKVFQGACRLIQLGFRQGGKPGYGYRRMLVGEDGRHKCILRDGEHKCIQTDHVILVPGPKSEVKTVNWIFRQFVNQRRPESEIAERLNKRGILNHVQKPWNRAVIYELLTNEKYIGTNVYHRTSFKLQKKYVNNPREMWIRAENAFKGIVPKPLFEAARQIVLRRAESISDEHMLNRLRLLLAKHGKLTGALVNRFGKGPLTGAYRYRFGSMGAAYSLIGYCPPRDYSYKEKLLKLRRKYPEVIASVRQQLESLDCVVEEDEASRILTVDELLTIRILLCRHYVTDAGASRWVITSDQGVEHDLIIAARMDASADSIRDYYLLPTSELPQGRLWLGGKKGTHWNDYRFDSLGDLYTSLGQIISECREAAKCDADPSSDADARRGQPHREQVARHYRVRERLTRCC